MRFSGVLLLSIVLIAGCAGSTGRAVQPTSSAPVGLEIGNKAPDFSVTSIDGRVLRLSDFSAQDRPVVVEFITTWCPYCRQDLGQAGKVYGQYKDRVEYIVIGLDLNEGSGLLTSYKSKNGFPGAFAVGNRNVLVDYNVRSTTTKYAIDKDGLVVWKGSGAMPSSSWQKLFEGVQA